MRDAEIGGEQQAEEGACPLGEGHLGPPHLLGEETLPQEALLSSLQHLLRHLLLAGGQLDRKGHQETLLKGTAEAKGPPLGGAEGEGNIFIWTIFECKMFAGVFDRANMVTSYLSKIPAIDCTQPGN